VADTQRNYVNVLATADRKGWPRCHVCDDPAVIVCAPSGHLDADSDFSKGTTFCCDKHTDDTYYQYWMWIIPEDDPECTSATEPNLHKWDFLVHLGHKTWGAAFIAWLLDAYSLASYHRPKERQA